MALTELTPAQRATVDALVVARRLERVPIDANRCMSFLEQARVALADLPNVTHAQNRHNLAYDAAHDVGEAMLAGHGYRTGHGRGQHEALALFMGAIFDTPPENAAAQHVEQMRRERNAQRYHATPHTEASAQVASDAAKILYAVGEQRAVR